MQHLLIGAFINIVHRKLNIGYRVLIHHSALKYTAVEMATSRRHRYIWIKIVGQPAGYCPWDLRIMNNSTWKQLVPLLALTYCNLLYNVSTAWIWMSTSTHKYTNLCCSKYAERVPLVYRAFINNLHRQGGHIFHEPALWTINTSLKLVTENS